MSNKESAIEVKVGALVLFSLMLLVGFIYVLGDFNIDEGVVIHVDYANIGGLKPGAPVKQAGIEIGKVRTINYRGTEPNKQTGEAILARVSIEVDPRFVDTVRENSAFYITSEGVLGEKFVSVETLDLKAKEVSDAQVYRGVDPMRLEKMISKLSKNLDNLGALLERLNDKDLPLEKLMQDIDALAVNTNQIIVENREKIGDIVGHADEFIVNANTFVQNANATLEESRPKVRSILDNVDLAAADARTTLRIANSTMKNLSGVVGRVGREVEPLVSAVKATLGNVKRLSQKAIDITEKAEPKLFAILDDAEAATKDVREVTSSAVEMVKYVQSGRGTVGGLLRDEEIFDSLREMLRELKRRPWKIVWKE